MYEVNRGKRIEETLRIKDADGGHVDFRTNISIDDVFREFTEVMRNIQAGQELLNVAKAEGDVGATAKMYEALGNMICALVRMAFGEEQGAKLLLLYDNAYVELLGEIMPFFRDVVTPKVEARLEAQTALYTSGR